MIKTFNQALSEKLPAIRQSHPLLAGRVKYAIENPGLLAAEEKRVILRKVNEVIAANAVDAFDLEVD